MPKHKAEPRTNPESDETWADVQPPPTHYDDAWQSAAIERLKKYGVNSAAALHPSLALIDAKLAWPSFSVSSFVSQAILEMLRQARTTFISNGFAVNTDPVNPLGDGKSWELRCEITGKIADDPIGVATRCQKQYASHAPAPFWDEGLITVPLWSSGVTSIGSRRAGEQMSRSPLLPPRLTFVSLALLLKRQGLSRPDLARKAGVDYKTVSEYMKSKRRPYDSNLKKIADALGVEVAELP